MAGGLFGKPFALNVKCVIFSLVCMSLFLYSPRFKSKTALGITLFIIFCVSYVAMAWYDYFFDCRILPFKRGSRSTLGALKPKVAERQEGPTTEEKKRERYLIYFSHLLIIAPFVAWVSLKGRHTPPLAFALMGALAGLTFLYHGYKIVNIFH